MSKVLLVALMLIFAANHQVVNLEQSCAHYDPEIVKLSGQLSIDDHYGPPNFGEHPATDEKLHVAILHLTQPLDVCGDNRSDLTGESFKGLRSVQMNFVNLTQDPKYLAGKTIAVQGKLYRAHSGYHFTEVLMTVDSVRVVR
jgi:hypothetical protein